MTDTLTIDTLALSQWRANPEYDYGAEFRGSSFSLLEWIDRWLDDLFRRLFGDVHLGDWTNVVWYVVGFAVIACVVTLVLYRHPELLHWRRRGKKQPDYTIKEDTIYGIDFPAAIASAMQRGDWREAVRLGYLQALRCLSDAGMIDWQPSKTPSQYVGECADERLRGITATFVRVRYGGFDATQGDAESVTGMARAIIASVAARAAGEKGGGA